MRDDREEGSASLAAWTVQANCAGFCTAGEHSGSEQAKLPFSTGFMIDQAANIRDKV